MSTYHRILAIAFSVLLVQSYCSEVIAAKIYWTKSGGNEAIMRSNLDGTEVEPLIVTNDSRVRTPRGIALDLAQGKLYWSNVGEWTIMRANLDGTGIEPVVIGVEDGPAAIALDVTAGKVYWTASGRMTISRANLDGSNREVLLSFATGGVRRPEGLELDIANGKMYWCDLVSVRRANLDGSDMEILVTPQPEEAYLAGLALDLNNGKMYWSNEEAGIIRRANLDGSNVEDVMPRGPFDLAVDSANSKLYFSSNAIFYAGIDGSGQKMVPGTGVSGRIYGFAIDEFPVPVPEPSAIALAAIALILGTRRTGQLLPTATLDSRD